MITYLTLTTKPGAAESKEDDEDDNHKFFKKIQQCFSSNPNRNRKNSEDLVDVNEREEKQKSYSE